MKVWPDLTELSKRCKEIITHGWHRILGTSRLARLSWNRGRRIPGKSSLAKWCWEHPCWKCEQASGGCFHHDTYGGISMKSTSNVTHVISETVDPFTDHAKMHCWHVIGLHVYPVVVCSSHATTNLSRIRQPLHIKTYFHVQPRIASGNIPANVLSLNTLLHGGRFCEQVLVLVGCTTFRSLSCFREYLQGP